MHSMILSVLDLLPLTKKGGSTQALSDAVALAQEAEALGFERYWAAEHHNMQALACSVPEILLAALTQRTSRIRLGSGGIMLPNHAPLRVAETFRMLEALAPGRIDLGLGRAPGTDSVTAYALRRTSTAGEEFEAQLAELLAFCGLAQYTVDHPFARIHAAPTDQPLPPLWMLSSSGHGAVNAAELGAGLAFALHINPDVSLAKDAIARYRRDFTPSAGFDTPQAMVAQNVVMAPTDAEARELALPLGLMFLRLRRNETAPFPTQEEARAYPYTEAERQIIEQMQDTGRMVVGSPQTVKARLDSVLEATQADELMVSCLLPDLPDRLYIVRQLAQMYLG